MPLLLVVVPLLQHHQTLRQLPPLLRQEVPAPWVVLQVRVVLQA